MAVVFSKCYCRTRVTLIQDELLPKTIHVICFLMFVYLCVVRFLFFKYFVGSQSLTTRKWQSGALEPWKVEWVLIKEIGALEIALDIKY